MATALDQMISHLRLMLTVLEQSNDPEQMKEDITNPSHAHERIRIFRLAHERFDEVRTRYPEFLTDDELAKAWRDGELALANSGHLPCGEQDRIGDRSDTLRDEWERRSLEMT